MKKTIFSRPLYVLLALQFLALNLFAQAPTITSFTPSSGSVGTLVTITGTNLESPTAFTIGGTAAIVISNTGTSLVGLVMPGAVTGDIVISNGTGTATSVTNFTVTLTNFPNAQQGNKLIGTGNVGAAKQARQVSVSADGNTAVVGGFEDNTSQGALWIYTRSGSNWSQQGNKLVANDNTGAAWVGTSVGISADGNTVIAGGPADNGHTGATWIFTRNAGVWTQQGSKLLAADGNGWEGLVTDLSADGNTAIIGSSVSDGAWIWKRSAGTWSQQGGILRANDNIGAAGQGTSVSISADGNTAIIGGDQDDNVNGAAWIWTQSGGVWSKQAKLIGTGAIGAARQGRSVSISADGNTAIVGGSEDNGVLGAAWIFTRTGSTWNQQGNKLVGTGGGAGAQQGIAVSISADGNTAMVGGDQENDNVGAAWVFTRTAGVWTQRTMLAATGNIGQSHFGQTISLSSDGETAFIGGSNDNGDQGAAWVYTYVPPPTITSFTPASGPVGTLVTITGTNLGSPTALTIGATAAIVISNNGTSLVGMVMPGAVTGTISLTTASGSVTSAGTFTLSTAPAPNGQQGSKLVGLGNVGAANQGFAVSLSADGNTAIVGGQSDNSNMGAAWIYTRTGTSWSQQGTKLVGTGNSGITWQGIAVSINADGNTAIVGGTLDNSNQGAAWIFTRSGTTWSQQGSKLVGTGNTGAAQQGRAVSLSADGNTAIVGGPNDDTNQGAAWIFTRSGTTWSQQGAKLVGTGNSGEANQGHSVSLSADGNTAIVGGLLDDSNQGAAWVYTRTGTTWSQQGAKLVGTGNIGEAQQGRSVSLSADGNTAIVGGNWDDSNQGAVWIFTRSGTTWSQQGTKLVGTGNIGAAKQGFAVSLSADGNIAIVGGFDDNSSQGAAWVYTRSGTTWSQQGVKQIGTGNIGAAFQGTAVSLSADGTTAIVGGQDDNSSQGAAWVYTYVPPPTITSFSPTSGPVGTLVTITGTNLGSPTAFTIGGTPAIIISNTGTSLVGMVMPGAVTGTISLTTAGGSVTSAGTFTLSTAPAPNAQQGAKLVGTGNTGAANQGFSVSVSADGNTSIVGAWADNGNQGAAWIFTRSGTIWSQQGTKLVGTGNTGAARQGQAVSLSADGNTAIVGGWADNGNQGAVWIFTRSGTTWSQQGAKLVGTGNTGAAVQGRVVSLSADGNTAIVGGWKDDSDQGAAWIFTRSGTTWSQQGNKLVGTGNTGAAQQGIAVSLSLDGNTAIIGGRTDNSNQGAAWIFTRSGTTWSQQGNKLVGTGNTGAAQQGIAVSLNADGNTAIVGGWFDNSEQGATWIYTRTGTTWSQQGAKLVGTENTGTAQQGYSVSVSADGNTAIVGGWKDNSNQGAAWIFTRSGTTWSQQGTKRVGTGNTGAARQGISVSLSADGTTSILGGDLDNSSNGAAWVYNYVPPPTIASITPTSAASGATITLTGTDFTGATAVSFGGTAATSFNVVSATSITAVVAAGTSGNVIVTTPGGTGTLAGFTFIPAPVVTSFTPTSAGSTTTVTLTGTDFTGATAVSFGGTAATSFNVVSATSITAVVAAGTSGNVSVTTPGGTGTLAGFTFIPAPIITSFTPTSAGSTTTVTLTGTNFTGATAVSFGGTAATSFNVVSATSITAVVAAGTSGDVSVTTPGGTSVLAGFTFIPAPVITSFTPTSAATGATVTLTGTDFTGATVVSFGGTAATSFNVVSATSITAVVAAGTSGNVSVTTPGGTGTLAGFTFIPAPVVTSFTPTSAGSTTTVTLTGTDFTGATAVSFGGTAATSFNVVSATSITALIAAGTSGNVSVTTPGGTGTLAGFTFIPAPIITSFTPTSAGSTTTVTLTGTNFTGATAVSFGGTAATSFNVVSATSITAVVAAGTSGDVSVTTPGGAGTLAGFTFIPTPVISSFTPTSAATGATVTLTGTNFTGATAVSFGGTAATSFNVVSATSITALIAAGTSGEVSISTPGGTGTLAGFTILSSNANLASLALSTGTLSPVFASTTTSYTATVPFASSSVTLTPTRTEGTASIRVNGVTVASGTASASIDLALGSNTISTVVTAGDGTTTRTYSIVITREGPGVSSNADLSAISLSSGTLSPVFASGSTSYTAAVPFASSSITLTPTRAEGTASIRVNGVTVASGTASASIALAVGSNTISTVVTAGDGTTSRTYSIIITRLAGTTNANLSAMTISSGTLSPVFVPATLNYTAFVNNNVSSITINPRSEENSTVIQVNGNVVASQSNSGNIPLTIGSNTVRIVLTSENGINQKTYTIRVTRLRQDQILTNDTGNVTASDTAREIVVISPNLPLNINVLPGTSAPITVVYGDLITSGKGTVPKTSITTQLAKIEIPASTQITASGTSWNGSLLAPNISSYEIPAKPGFVIKKGLIVEIGSTDFSLSFDKAIRIVLFGEAGKKVSRVSGNIYQEILQTGPDTQVAGDALAANSSFKVNVGNDLVIWTKGLSRFITFTETEDLDVALVSADKNALTNDLIKGTNADLSSITTAISLPSTGPNGSAITWSSSNPSAVSADGRTIVRPLFGSGDVTLTLTATLTKGSITETKTFSITVLQLPNQAPAMNVIANQTLCYTTASQTIALSGITPGPETSQTTVLSVSSSNSTLFSGLTVVAGTGGTAQLRFTPGNASGGTATVTVTVKDDGGTANGGLDTFSRTFTISINPLPVINISSDLGTSISKGLTAQLSASGGTSYTWSNAQGIISGQNSPILTIRPAATTTYTVTVSNATACINTNSLTITVIDDYQALKVNNILSPNGDGKNDLLIIKNLDMYPNNTLRIFNKAGREIYTKVNYANEWDGTFNGTALVEDTYFYIVDFGQGLHKLKGFVSIVR